MAQITNELTLEDGFTYQIKTVSYDWINSTVSVEVIFKEGEYPHSRRFEYEATNGMIEANIIALINKEGWSNKGTKL